MVKNSVAGMLTAAAARAQARAECPRATTPG
jgi:hypothetical protein